MNECKSCNSEFKDTKIVNRNGINIEVCPYCFDLFNTSKIENNDLSMKDILDSLLSNNVANHLISKLHTTNYKFFIPLIAFLMTIAIIFPLIVSIIFVR